jgi:class III cytochrome C family protein
VRSRPLWVLIGAGVLGVIVLSVAAPQKMISPGALMRGHAQIETNCFACHAPWRGATAQRCIRCHQLADIGLRTTAGMPLPNRTMKVSFHQELIEQDCMACHVDHIGDHIGDHVGDHIAESAGAGRRPFSHTMLRPAVRTACEVCHAARTDTIHRDLTVGCARCHRTDGWKPSDFDHAALAPVEQQHCQGCHRPPPDALHTVLRGQCEQCHSQKHWKPSTFDHAPRFVLDADHNASCATCHTDSDIRRYSCYGCHAHRPDQIRAVHAEEGIRDFANCVRCHRSASAEPEGGEGRGRERD